MLPNFDHLEKFRQPHPATGDRGGPTWGYFKIPKPPPNPFGTGHHFIVIACGALSLDWEHVSVHGRFYNKGKPFYFLPHWPDMCFIKNLFWPETECVMQLHVPKSEHINIHDHVLHLWRPVHVQIPQPPPELV